jgi:hypothetical protein
LLRGERGINATDAQSWSNDQARIISEMMVIVVQRS